MHRQHSDDWICVYRHAIIVITYLHWNGRKCRNSLTDLQCIVLYCALCNSAAPIHFHMKSTCSILALHITEGASKKERWSTGGCCKRNTKRIPSHNAQQQQHFELRAFWPSFSSSMFCIIICISIVCVQHIRVHIGRFGMVQPYINVVSTIALSSLLLLSEYNTQLMLCICNSKTKLFRYTLRDL